jgi:hypothetical protein
MQMYTYYLRPVLVGHEAQISSQSGAQHRLEGSSVGDSTLNAAFLEEGQGDAVHSWEVQLVLEYCDQGSLRQLLNKTGPFKTPGTPATMRQYASTCSWWDLLHICMAVNISMLC